MTVRMEPAFDTRAFRHALGHFPTGVCVVTARVDGAPVGMTVNSFNSLSLDPPLVLFSVGAGAASLPLWRRAEGYAVNVLAENQNLTTGWRTPAGYPKGIQEKILSGALDETAQTGNRTRLLRFEPGARTALPFVHDYWEEVFLVSGDLIVGDRQAGSGLRAMARTPTPAVRPASRTVRSGRRAGACCSRSTSTARRLPHFDSVDGASAPAPSCGGGPGWGVARTAEVIERAAVRLSHRTARPPPCPPPQGGRRRGGAIPA